MASVLAASCKWSSMTCNGLTFQRGLLKPSVVRPSTSKGAYLTVRSAQNQGPPPLQTPADFGKGKNGAWFGFGERQELNVGRLAMMGFASALVMEVVTGKGVLGQLGLDPIVVRYPFLLGFTFLLVGGLVGGYVLNNPPDFSKAPANLGDGLPRNPFDKSELDRIPTFTRGGIVDRDNGQKGREPYVSDLKDSEN